MKPIPRSPQKIPSFIWKLIIFVEPAKKQKKKENLKNNLSVVVSFQSDQNIIFSFQNFFGLHLRMCLTFCQFGNSPQITGRLIVGLATPSVDRGAVCGTAEFEQVNSDVAAKPNMAVSSAAPCTAVWSCIPVLAKCNQHRKPRLVWPGVI